VFLFILSYVFIIPNLDREYGVPAKTSAGFGLLGTGTLVLFISWAGIVTNFVRIIRAQGIALPSDSIWLNPFARFGNQYLNVEARAARDQILVYFVSSLIVGIMFVPFVLFWNN
jgi:hypothetical protein